MVDLLTSLEALKSASFTLRFENNFVWFLQNKNCSQYRLEQLRGKFKLYETKLEFQFLLFLRTLNSLYFKNEVFRLINSFFPFYTFLFTKV